MPSTIHKPFIAASQKQAELTLRSVLLGTLFALVFASANIYLGLYAGLTISASIPAAILAMAILQHVLRNGTVLETTMVQTMASSGEAIAAAAIYTLPALLIAGVWKEVDFWTTTLICSGGGLLGAVLMQPLRKSYIVEDRELFYPESVALTEVIKASDRGGAQAKQVFGAVVLSGVMKFFSSGIVLFKGSVESAFPVGRTAFFIGTDVSAALVGVGYIVGLNIACMMVLGGAIAWWVTIPVVGLSRGVTTDVLGWYWEMWASQIRYMGVGAMMVGGAASIFRVRHTMLSGIEEVFQHGRKSQKASASNRTSEMLSGRSLGLCFGAALVLSFFGFQTLMSTKVALLCVGLTLVLCFFLVAVAGYITGLVGSSNAPVSGITLMAVLVTGLLFVVAGVAGTMGVVGVLGIAAAVCSAVCISGEMSQQLKAGYWLGATPRKQSWAQIIGLAAACLALAPILTVLSETYGIGTGLPGALKAPQATLFASIAQALFGDGSLPWNMVGLGASVGVGLLGLDAFLQHRDSKVRFPLMAVAVGMYLPLTVGIPMALGGMVHQISRDKSNTGSGILFASGLVAGESLMGVGLGAVMYFFPKLLPWEVANSDALSLAVLGGLTYTLWRVSKKSTKH